MKFLRTLRGLVCEGERDSVSIGRVAFWIIFGIACYKWANTTDDIQPNMAMTLWFLLVYNLGKKGLNLLREMKGLQPGNAKPEDPAAAGAPNG